MYKASILLATGALVAALIASSTIPAAAQEVVPALEEAAQIDMETTGMEFAPPYLYLLTRAGVVVYDVSDPDAPAKIGAYETGAHLHDAIIQGERLYAVGHENVYVFDVSQPISPTLAAEFPLEGTHAGSTPAIAVEGNWLYVLVTQDDLPAWRCELRAYDLSDLDQVVRVDTLTVAGDQYCEFQPTSLFVQNRTAYFLTASRSTRGGCCSYVSVADIGDDGLLTPRHLQVASAHLQIAIAPDDDGTVYMTVGLYAACGIGGHRSAIFDLHPNHLRRCSHRHHHPRADPGTAGIVR